MKSSTLHRSTLSKERMSMVQNVKPQVYDNVHSDINQYIKFQKKPELDVLWRDFEKSVQSRSKAKAPIVYLGMGFVLGLLFTLAIIAIIGIATYSDANKADVEGIKPVNSKVEAPVSVMPSSTGEATNKSKTGTEEKYTIQPGDTLDKIAVKFYGEYDQTKIDKIMELNSIKDPTRIQIGQTLMIPLD